MVDDQGTKESNAGSYLALVVGLGLLGGAGYVAMSGGGPVGATILALIGASALSGWARSRRSK